MIEYQTCEINPNHYIKILKCTSDSRGNESEKHATIDEKLTRPANNPVIIIIPGNPGVIEFYEQFARDLNSLTGYDILGISHTGHLFHEQITQYWEPADVLTQVNDKVKLIIR